MVKKILILVLAIAIKINAQVNLVPNGGFESYTICPNMFGQSYKALGWSGFRSTPDYFNSCANYSTGLSTPKNDAGFQFPSSGEAYLGLIAYYSNSEAEFEAAGIQLLNPLSIGVKYYASMKVCLSSKDPSWSSAASNHLGITFTKNLFDFASPKPLNNIAKVFSNNIITDTLSWTHLSGSFISDSAYNFIVIGNFFDAANTSTVSLFPTPLQISYYFIDDVRLSTDSIFVNSIKESIPSEIELKIYPNPFDDIINIISKNEIKITIFDSFGRVVHFSILSGAMQYLINTAHFESGQYLCFLTNVDNGNIIYKTKLIKTKNE